MFSRYKQIAGRVTLLTCRSKFQGSPRVVARPRRLFLFCCYEQRTNIAGNELGATGAEVVDSKEHLLRHPRLVSPPQVAVVFIATQWIITVEALLENKSKARHQFDDFIFEIRYTLPADELQNKKVDDETTLSAKFPHVAAKGSWLNDAEDPDDRDDYGVLEPAETDRRTFIACVPKNATMLRACSELFEEGTDESWQAIKVMAVPGSAEGGTMSIDQQIDKLKGHVLIFSDEFRDLILGFEMLVPVAENQELLKRFSQTKRAHGLQIVRGSLIQECIIGITKLAYDPGSNNPTAVRLIETILNLPSRTLNKLKDAFSVPIKAVLASDRPSTEADLQFWQEIEKMEVQELRQSF